MPARDFVWLDVRFLQQTPVGSSALKGRKLGQLLLHFAVFRGELPDGLVMLLVRLLLQSLLLLQELCALLFQAVHVCRKLGALRGNKKIKVGPNWILFIYFFKLMP